MTRPYCPATDATPSRASDGDTLYRMPSHLIDNLCQAISIETNLVALGATNDPKGSQ